MVQPLGGSMGENLLPETMAKDLKDIRNHIKAYANGFDKSQRRVATVDDAQDRNFNTKIWYRLN